MPNRPYPYGLSWKDMQPEPTSIAGAQDPIMVIAELNALSADAPGPEGEELKLILDAAFGLAMKMLLDPEYTNFSRGELMTIAIDTAIIWARG